MRDKLILALTFLIFGMPSVAWTAQLMPQRDARDVRLDDTLKSYGDVKPFIADLALMNESSYKVGKDKHKARFNQIINYLKTGKGIHFLKTLPGATGIPGHQRPDPHLVLLFEDPVAKKLFIIFRGSVGPLYGPDWLANFYPVNCNVGRSIDASLPVSAFPGLGALAQIDSREAYVRRANSTLTGLILFLDGFFEEPQRKAYKDQYQIILSGHSQGAALAQITQLLLVKLQAPRLWGATYDNVEGRKMISYSFSPAMVAAGSAQLWEAMVGRFNIIGQRVRTDIVPHLGAKTPLRLKKLGFHMVEDPTVLRTRIDLYEEIIQRARGGKHEVNRKDRRYLTHYTSAFHPLELCKVDHGSSCTEKSQHFIAALADPTGEVLKFEYEEARKARMASQAEREGQREAPRLSPGRSPVGAAVAPSSHRPPSGPTEGPASHRPASSALPFPAPSGFPSPAYRPVPAVDCRHLDDVPIPPPSCMRCGFSIRANRATRGH